MSPKVTLPTIKIAKITAHTSNRHLPAIARILDRVYGWRNVGTNDSSHNEPVITIAREHADVAVKIIRNIVDCDVTIDEDEVRPPRFGIWPHIGIWPSVGGVRQK